VLKERVAVYPDESTKDVFLTSVRVLGDLFQGVDTA
jgi:hypothetical protein